MTNRSRLFFVAMAVIFSLTLSSRQVAAAEVRSIRVDGVADWAVHESSGRVFYSLTEGNEIVEIDSLRGEVRRFTVGQTPTEIIVKRDHLIVACTKAPALFIIDLKANKVVGSVNVNGQGPSALFCSQVDNNYAYCICNADSPSVAVLQIDLKNLNLRKQSMVYNWGQSDPMHVAMTPDGKWIVPDARGSSSPSGADLMKVDEEDLTFTQIHDHHSSFGQIVAGPMNRFWTLGNALYSLDITKKLRIFGGSPVAIHPQLDLAASYGTTGVTLERFSDASPVESVQLGSSTTKATSNSSRSRSRSFSPEFDSTIKFDLKNNLLFVGDAKGGNWINLQEHADDLSPLRMVVAPSETSTLVGKEFRIPVSVTSPNAQPKVKLEIKSGPEGAKLSGGALVWTPKAAQVGFQYFVFAVKDASDAKVLDEANMTVHVTLPKVDLGFSTRSMSLSPDGKTLLVWGSSPDSESRSDDIAVVDVESLKVTVKKTLPQGVRCATIDNKYLFIAPNSGNLIFRLRHDLSDSKRLFLKSPPKKLVKISETQLAVFTYRPEIFDVDAMKPISASNSAFGNLQQLPQESPPVVDLQGGILRVGQRVVNSKSKELLRYASPTRLPDLVPARNSRYNPRSNQQYRIWGRKLVGTSLQNHAGSRIALLSRGPGLITRQWPMALMIGASNSGKTVNRTLQLCDLVDGTIRHTSVIDIGKNTGRSVNHYSTTKPLIVHGTNVFVLNDKELLVSSIPVEIANKMPTPAHFTDKQTTELKIGKVETISLGVAGDLKGASFHMLAEHNGIKLDESTGKLSVNTKMLWDNMISLGLANTGFAIKSRSKSSPWSKSENEKQYQILTGKKLPAGQLAAALNLSVVVRDSEEQEDAMHFAVVVTGPRKELETALAKQRESREKQFAEAKRRLEEQRQQAKMAAEQAMAGKQGEDSVPERLGKLEARMRRIEAAIDSILKKLDER